MEQHEATEAIRKKRSTRIINAFMIGVVIYSAVRNGLGLVTLIPLVIVYKLVNGSKREKG
ncbi:MAG: hypothetical protein KDC00_06205 [Flavobacteriales bacterium]|nr:hypothetical protein [Flavobacteriales bacterium]